MADEVVAQERGVVIDFPQVKVDRQLPGRRMPRTCQWCGETFLARVTNVAQGWGRYCSRSHAGMARRGELAGRWRGGEMRLGTGRVMVKKPEHGKANKYGYVLRYVVVAEELLGRFLLPGEVVHHLNGDPADDRPENLEVMWEEDHKRLHGLAGAERVRGERNHNARLTEEAVREARRRFRPYTRGGESLRGLAAEFGVTVQTMGRALRGASWRHVE